MSCSCYTELTATSGKTQLKVDFLAFTHSCVAERRAADILIGVPHASAVCPTAPVTELPGAAGSRVATSNGSICNYLISFLLLQSIASLKLNFRVQTFQMKLPLLHLSVLIVKLRWTHLEARCVGRYSEFFWKYFEFKICKWLRLLVLVGVKSYQACGVLNNLAKLRKLIVLWSTHWPLLHSSNHDPNSLDLYAFSQSQYVLISLLMPFSISQNLSRACCYHTTALL